MIHANIDDPGDDDDAVVGDDTFMGDDALIGDDAGPDGEAGEISVVPESPDGANTRPCAYCGRPVSQRASAGRPFRYCRDNDDQCLRAARNARMRQRNAPGLAGQVAQAFEVVDRLDKVVETLTSSPNVTRPGRRPNSGTPSQFARSPSSSG
jgi:hypothetical protein